MRSLMPRKARIDARPPRLGADSQSCSLAAKNGKGSYRNSYEAAADRLCHHLFRLVKEGIL